MPSLDPGFFWYKLELTMRSPLTPGQVCQRLSAATPRFDVETGERALVMDVLRRRNVYSLKVRERASFIRGTIVFRSIRALGAKGAVEPDEGGSRIRLTVENGALAAPLIMGLWLAVAAVYAIANDWLMLIPYGGVALIALGIMQYLLLATRGRRSLDPLVVCLETMLNARRVE